MTARVFRLRRGRTVAHRDPPRVNGDWITGKHAVTPGLILAEFAIQFAIIFVVCLFVLWATP